MRKTPTILRALFPTIRGEILAAALTQPDKWWYLSELAQFLQRTPSSLQRDLRSLVGGGILEQRRDGRRMYVRPDPRSPVFADLTGVIAKTAGLLPMLRAALAPLRDRVACAFVYGSVARGTEQSTSDVDLMVIGAVGLADLVRSIREVEKRSGREVNVTTFSASEFATQARRRDQFVSTVLKSPKQFVKGDQRDLDDVVGKRRRAAAPHVEARAR